MLPSSSVVALLGAGILLLAARESHAEVSIKRYNPEVQIVLRGGTAKFKCEITGMDAEDTVIWKINDMPLFMDGDAALSEERYMVDEDYGTKPGYRMTELTILRADANEDAQFRCGTLDSDFYLASRLKVHVPPTAKLTPEQWPYKVVTNSSVTFRCHTSGNPKPTIHWSKEGSKISTYASMEGETLRFATVQRHDAGIYTCTANSSAGTFSSSVDMRVQDAYPIYINETAPWIKTEKKYRPLELGGSVNLTCTTDGNPEPLIEWYFNGQRLQLSRDIVRDAMTQYAQREGNETVTTLEIRNATAEYWGDYACMSSNNLARVSAPIFVTGYPSPPELSIDGTILNVIAQAPKIIHRFAVYYRLPNESGWHQKKMIEVNPGDQSQVQTWSKQIDLGNLLPAGDYEVQVQASNEIGWGNRAKDIVRVSIPLRDKALATSAPSTVLLTSFLASLFAIAL